MNFLDLSKTAFHKQPSILLLASASLLCSSAYAAEDTIPNLILRAQSAIDNGQPQQATEWYEKAAAMGESPEAEIGLVRAYLQAGEFRKAIAFGNLVAAEHPDMTDTAALLAYIEDLEGQTTPALAKLTEELKKHPDDVALNAAEAEILLNRMAVTQAIQKLDDWIARNPAQGDIYLLRARAALVAGKHEDLSIWRTNAALAYEANGELESAKPLRSWLSTQGPQSAITAPTLAQKSVDEKAITPTSSRWPVHPMESFPPAEHSGNGFIIDKGRRVVTNASLVSKPNNEIWIRNGLGKIRKAKLEKTLPEQGLALLKLDTAYPKTWSLPDHSFNAPGDVHFCFVLGFPITEALEKTYPVLSPGIVVRPDTGYGGLMQVTSSLGSENSGSPIFDGSGKFIGMTLAKQEPLKGVTDRDALLGKGTFAVRANEIQKLLPSKAHSKKKPLKNKAVQGNPSVEELYENLLPTVVTIVVTP